MTKSIYIARDIEFINIKKKLIKLVLINYLKKISK